MLSLDMGATPRPANSEEHPDAHMLHGRTFAQKTNNDRVTLRKANSWETPFDPSKVQLRLVPSKGQKHLLYRSRLTSVKERH